MNTLWRIWKTVTVVMLWRLRNKVVFENEEISVQETQAAIQAAETYQVMAIASAWKRSDTKRIQGLCLGICHSIMTTIEPTNPAPALAKWKLQYHISTNPEEQVNGGWILLREEADITWHGVTASSIRFPTHGTRQANAVKILDNGLQKLKKLGDAAKTYLRIDSVDKTIQKFLSAKPATTQSDSPIQELDQELQRFFVVQWSTPAKADLEAVRTLTQTHKTRQFYLQQPSTTTDPMQSNLSNFKLQDQPGATPPRQMNDIKSRLLYYQKASIENT